MGLLRWLRPHLLDHHPDVHHGEDDVFLPGGWRVADELRFNQGHRGIFLLARTNDAPGWYGLAPEGLYLIDGAEVVDTDRSYPLVRKVESMTVARRRCALQE